MAKLKKQTIATALGVTPGRVSQLIKLGMPTASVEQARTWRDRNIRPRISFTPTVVVAPQPDPSLPTVAEWIAWALDAAGVDIVARLHVEAGLPLESGDLAVSCVAVALADALATDMPAEDIALTLGPTSPARPDAEVRRNTLSIAMRVGALQRQDAADADA